MRIRAISVRNWACIESLELADLHDGIIVLYGPNRTGKSSLVQALRSCLFDHFHDSTHKDIKRVINWRSKAAPHAAVEIELGADRYRIAKTFAKTKEGGATLEIQNGAGWTLVERGKEAAKKMQELAGVDKSAAGVYQMLWLGQEGFQLPAPAEIDATLAKALEAVLGTMITGPDIDFKCRLDQACERWFTPKMKDKTGSPLASLDARLVEARAAKAEIDRQWSEAESALSQYDAAQRQKPQLEHDLQKAEDELSELRTEREALAARAAQLDLALRNRDQARLLLTQAAKERQDWSDAKTKLERVDKNRAEAGYSLQAADDIVRQTDAQRLQARRRLHDLERELGEQQNKRTAAGDQQKLLNLATSGTALDQKLQKIAEDQKELDEVTTKMAGPAVLSEKQIEQLRNNRKEATRLQAQLEAAEIRVAIQVTQPLDAKVGLDGQPTKNASLFDTKEQVWLVRQHAEFVLGGLATIRVGRGQEDRNLEAIAGQLTGLNRDFEDALHVAQVNSSDEAPIDTLVKRRLEHERHLAELNRLRASITQLAPEGLPALQALRQNLRQQQETIFARHPELRGWTPNATELDHLLTELTARETALKADVQQARQALHELEEALAQHHKRQQSITTQIEAHSYEAAALEEKLRRHDHSVLTQAVADMKARLEEAEKTVRDAALSEAERAIEARFQAALQAQKLRDLRLRENEKQLLRLQTQLLGTEGLHQKRTQAEQTLADLTRDRERESLNAAAHRHLKELFEQIRHDQVRRTVGPINDRVMTWARQLGLTEYTGLSFGEAMLPGGLLPAHVADGEPVGLDNESWGTLEQLSLLIRLAVGGLLAKDEPAVAILDDPLAHADLAKHRKMLEIFERAVRGESHSTNPAGPLQLIILTCHPERFDYLASAQHIDLAAAIRRA